MRVLRLRAPVPVRVRGPGLALVRVPVRARLRMRPARVLVLVVIPARLPARLLARLLTRGRGRGGRLDPGPGPVRSRGRVWPGAGPASGSGSEPGAEPGSGMPDERRRLAARPGRGTVRYGGHGRGVVRTPHRRRTPTAWLAALRTARDDLGCTYFDWLSAVDEPGTGFRVAAHVVVLSPVRRLLVRTTVPHETPVLPTAVDVYAGAAWHERETHEMFGVDFEGHPGLDHLLLPESFEGHPSARTSSSPPASPRPGPARRNRASQTTAPRSATRCSPRRPRPERVGPTEGPTPRNPGPPRAGRGRAAGERPARAGVTLRPVRRVTARRVERVIALHDVPVRLRRGRLARGRGAVG